jgi:hypothetical protein
MVRFHATRSDPTYVSMGEFMKTVPFWGGMVCSALLLATWSLASFADEPPVPALKAEKAQAPDEKTRVSLVLYLGPQHYKMGDVNHGIEQVSATGFQTKKLSGGTGFGAGIRVAPSSRLSLQFDYNHLIANAKATGLVQTVHVEEQVEMPANALLLTAGVHRQWHGIHYGLGVGPGYYLTHGKLAGTAGAQSISYTVHGKGFGFHVLGLADIGISRHLRFEGVLGYRIAKTGNLKVADTDVTLGDGSTLKADYSGITTRFGFSIPFDPGHYPETQNLK